MTEQKIETETAQGSAGKNGRRRFFGVGAATAPFLLTLVSQPALGVTCFTPSRSLSKNTSITQASRIGNCSGAKSAGDYQLSNGLWPASMPPTTAFHPRFTQGSIKNKTKFLKTVSTQVVSKTMGEVIAINSNGEVHRHLLAAYLNKKGGGGASIPEIVLTESAILAIWSEYAQNGFYAPFATVKWYDAEIINYLKSNGIVS